MNRHFPIRFHGKRKHFNEGCEDYTQGPRWFRRHRKHHHI
jgi:hypothetical protein